ncbi:DUF3592 domain-containing protein [bacterium]|nr:DUF3592 domain-containing protein [bacterium]
MFRVLTALFCLVAVIWLVYIYQTSLLPRVPAQVLEARLNNNLGGKVDALFRVEYQWLGKKREATLDAGYSSSSVALMEEEVKANPGGSTVQLTVNPHHPEQPMWPPDRASSFLGPGVFLLLGFFFWAIPEGVNAVNERKTNVFLVAWRTFGPIAAILLPVAGGMAFSTYQVGQTWTLVQGQVVKAESITATRRLSAARIVCKYQLGERQFEQPVYSHWRASNSAVQAWLAHYPPGSSLSLRCYPADPSLCRLEISGSDYLLAGGMLGMGIIFGGMALLFRKFA